MILRHSQPERGAKSSSSASSWRGDLPWILVTIGLATSVFWWLISKQWIIGNDYRASNIFYLMDYRAYQKLGVAPTWFPHIEGGIPISGFVLGQIFHFPSWILSRVPGFWSGDALYLMTIKHYLLLLLGLFMGYSTLRSLTPMPRWLCAALPYLFLVQLRTLDCLRYGPFYDALIYSFALTCVVVQLLYGVTLFKFLAVALFSYLLITAGYPMMVVYAAFAIAVVLVMLFLESSLSWKTALARSGVISLAAFLGLLLAAPYWLPFIDFLAVNGTRVAQATIDWANYSPLSIKGEFPSNLAALFANLILPWRAEVHSVFGGSFLNSVILVAALLICCALPRWSTFLFVVSVMFILLFAMGKATPVFPFFFNYVPGFSMSRVPGRFLAVFPLLLLGAAILVSNIIISSPHRAALLARLRALLGMSSVVVLGLVIVALSVEPVSVFGTLAPLVTYSAQSLNPSSWENESIVLFLCGSLVGALSLLGAVAAHFGSRLARLFLTVTGACAVSQAGYLFSCGTWVLPFNPYAITPSFERYEQADHLPLYGTPPLFVQNEVEPEAFGLATSQFSSFFKEAGGSIRRYLPLGERRRDAEEILLPLYLTDNIACVDEWVGSFRQVAHAVPPPALLMKSHELCQGARPAPRSSGAHAIALNRNLRLIALTPNLVTLNYRIFTKALLVTPYPAIEGWRVTIDDRPVLPVEINAGLWGVQVPAGKHQVRIEYKPQSYRYALWIFWSALCLLIIVIAVVIVARRNYRIVVVGAILLSCAGAIFSTEKLQEGQSMDIRLNNSFGPLLRQQIERWAALDQAMTGEIAADPAFPQ